MPFQTFAQTMACATTLASTGIRLGDGARNVTVYIPATASGTNVRFQTSHDGGTTYTNIRFAPISGSVAVTAVEIGSAATNTCVRVDELRGLEYLKAEYTSAVVTTAGTFKYLVEY